MSFRARVYRVLIASPSDVNQERDIAVRTIQAWNDLNSKERQIVLLPLRWEANAAPEYGKRPQEVINRQVVDGCDLAIGIFWTRVGSSTGVASSGTIEEIERVADAGKIVMLYFSQVKQDPGMLDLEQLANLRAFKEKTFPRALIDQYVDHAEFKDKLSRHLEMQLQTLLAEDAVGTEESPGPTGADIDLQFADTSNEPIGYELTLKTTYIRLDGVADLPDYEFAPVTQSKEIPTVAQRVFSRYTLPTANKDFYRQKATHMVVGSFFRSMRFWLQNKGDVGARDVVIELSLDSADQKQFCFLFGDSILEASPRKEAGSLLSSVGFDNTPERKLGDTSLHWATEFHVAALQPQRKVRPEARFAIGATEDCDIVVTAKIFADVLREPIVRTLKVRIEVESAEIDGKDLLEVMKSDNSDLI